MRGTIWTTPNQKLFKLLPFAWIQTFTVWLRKRLNARFVLSPDRSSIGFNLEWRWKNVSPSFRKRYNAFCRQQNLSLLIGRNNAYESFETSRVCSNHLTVFEHGQRKDSVEKSGFVWVLSCTQPDCGSDGLLPHPKIRKYRRSRQDPNQEESHRC